MYTRELGSESQLTNYRSRNPDAKEMARALRSRWKVVEPSRGGSREESASPLRARFSPDAIHKILVALCATRARNLLANRRREEPPIYRENCRGD